METLTITSRSSEPRTFGDSGREWTLTTHDGKFFTYYQAVAESVPITGGTYDCEVEVNTKGRFPKKIIKSVKPVGATAQAATMAATTTQPAPQAIAAVPAPQPAYENTRDNSFEWQTCLKEAGAIVREFAESPEWFRKGLIELLALKLGIEIPDVVSKATAERIGTLVAQTGQNWATFEKTVKEKHSGRKVAELTTGEAQSVIETLDLMIANMPTKQGALK
jgi:hypothetical protein